MSEDEYGYRITTKMVAWMRAFFADMGIPIEFKVDELTDDQIDAIITAGIFGQTEEAGKG